MTFVTAPQRSEFAKNAIFFGKVVATGLALMGGVTLASNMLFPFVPPVINKISATMLLGGGMLATHMAILMRRHPVNARVSQPRESSDVMAAEYIPNKHTVGQSLPKNRPGMMRRAVRCLGELIK